MGRGTIYALTGATPVGGFSRGCGQGVDRSTTHGWSPMSIETRPDRQRRRAPSSPDERHRTHATVSSSRREPTSRLARWAEDRAEPACRANTARVPVREFGFDKLARRARRRVVAPASVSRPGVLDIDLLSLAVAAIGMTIDFRRHAEDSDDPALGPEDLGVPRRRMLKIEFARWPPTCVGFIEARRGWTRFLRRHGWDQANGLPARPTDRRGSDSQV